MAADRPEAEGSKGLDGFSNVAKLGTSGRNAASQFSAVCRDLGAAGLRSTAARLRRIDEIVLDVPFPTLERLVAPERVVAEFEEARQAGVRRDIRFRNLLVLVPLVLTWLSLAVATYYYQRQIAADPNLITQPFLLLWEQGFGSDLALFPTFTVVAVADVVLLMFVLGYTGKAQRAERLAAKERGQLASRLDIALAYLGTAVEQSRARTPVSAEDWAVAAQKIIKDAMDQTRELAIANQRVVEGATATLETVKQEGQNLVANLARETTATLKAAQEMGVHLVERALAEATKAIQDAFMANRQLHGELMVPLARQFEATLAGFRRDHETYRASAAQLTVAVENLGGAADTLAGSSASYTGIAHAIDAHLTVIASSQEAFIGRVTDSVTSMGTAASAMQDVSSVLQERIRADLQRIASNVVDASERLAMVEGNLVGTSHALEDASRGLERAAGVLDRTAVRRRRVSRFRWFRAGRRSAA